MKIGRKEQLMLILNEVLALSDEEIVKELKEAEDSPWSNVFEELDRFSELFYKEHDPNNYNINIVFTRELT